MSANCRDLVISEIHKELHIVFYTLIRCFIVWFAGKTLQFIYLQMPVIKQC